MARKIVEIEDDALDENGLLKDGHSLKVKMFAMDSVQKSVAAAMHPHPSHHRQGYRFATDSEAKEYMADIYQQYDAELESRYKTASPEPVIDAGEAVLDQEFDGDEREQAYLEYDKRLQDAWRSK